MSCLRSHTHTQVHRALGELYGKVVVTHAHSASAMPPPSKRAKSGGGAGGRSQQILVQFRSRRRQAKREGSEKPEVFTKFVLRKENIVSVPAPHHPHSTSSPPHTIHSSHSTPYHSSQETLEAVSVLSQAIDCHTSQLAYAGCKDARAITTQCMTIR